MSVRDHKHNCNDTEMGVDLNRNYAYKWGTGLSTSDSEC